MLIYLIQKMFDVILKEKPKLVWIESPTNPLLKILDIQRIAKHCKLSNSLLVVDNTFATGLIQRPLDLGS